MNKHQSSVFPSFSSAQLNFSGLREQLLAAGQLLFRFQSRSQLDRKYHIGIWSERSKEKVFLYKCPIICFYTKFTSFRRRSNSLPWGLFLFPNRSCSLSVEKDGYSCTFTAELMYHSTFADYHTVDISLCDPQSCKLLKSSFSPAQHSECLLTHTLILTDNHSVIH